MSNEDRNSIEGLSSIDKSSSPLPITRLSTTVHKQCSAKLLGKIHATLGRRKKNEELQSWKYNTCKNWLSKVD